MYFHLNASKKVGICDGVTLTAVYSKTSVKRLLKNRHNKDLNDNW